MSWKTKDLIQNVNDYIKFYKINVNRSWTTIMKDKTIPIDQVITLDHLTNPDKK